MMSSECSRLPRGGVGQKKKSTNPLQFSAIFNILIIGVDRCSRYVLGILLAVVERGTVYSFLLLKEAFVVKFTELFEK